MTLEGLYKRDFSLSGEVASGTPVSCQIRLRVLRTSLQAESL